MSPLRYVERYFLFVGDLCLMPCGLPMLVGQRVIKIQRTMHGYKASPIYSQITLAFFYKKYYIKCRYYTLSD